MTRNPYKPLQFGALPVDLINDALDTELEPGNVRLSGEAHEHVAEDHPAADYPICMAALSSALASPTFIGQAPGHTRNFEIIKRINHPDRKSVLVAIKLEPDARGDYRIVSCYLIEAFKVEARRQKGLLKTPKPVP